MSKAYYLSLTRQEIINKLSVENNYFKVQELVGPEVYGKHKENSWFVLTTPLLRTILFLREKKGVSMYANNWHTGGSYDERGHRANIQDIVKSKTEKGIVYTSGHPLGLAIDFTFKGETAEETRDWIKTLEHELPHKIRLEHLKKDTDPNSETYGQMIPITWVHLDVKYFEDNPIIYFFNI